MAKLGIEVEGRLRGVPTLFTDAIAMARDGGADKVMTAMRQHEVTHVYISDRLNVLDYQQVGRWFGGYQVTLDVTKVAKQLRPANVTIILTLPHEYWESVANLGPQDQVKFHSEDRHVLCATMHSFVPTHPSEFEGDTDLGVLK